MSRQIQTRENGALGISMTLLALAGYGFGVWYFLFRNKKDPAESIRAYAATLPDGITVQAINNLRKVTEPTTFTDERGNTYSVNAGKGHLADVVFVDELGTVHAALVLTMADGTTAILRD